MKPILFLLCLSGVCSFSSFSFARTEVCPDKAPTGIVPQYGVTVKFDKKTSIYTYDYTVTNAAEATVPLWRFSVEADSEPASVTAGLGWENGGYSKESREIFWNYNSARKNVSSIKPGKKLGDFSIESKKPPQAVKVFADGDVADVPTVKFDNDEEEVDADKVACPGFFKGEGNDDQVVSVTTGPALDRVEAKIRVKRAQENMWKGNPDSEAELVLSPLDEGALEVVIFPGPKVDVAKIKLVSLEMGSGHAKINPAKVVIRADFKETTDSDAYAYLQKNKGDYLKVEFNLADMQIRCNADHALFLTGKFEDGRDLFGAVRMKPVPCDTKTFAPEAKRQRSKH